MIIQAELKRKQSEYEGEACVVDKVIELPAQRFQQFSRALLADYDFIAENKNAIRHDDARHCLLILDADGTDGVLVDPQGYNYARYSAFVPFARSLLTPDVPIDRSYLSPADRVPGLQIAVPVSAMLLEGRCKAQLPSQEGCLYRCKESDHHNTLAVACGSGFQVVPTELSANRYPQRDRPHDLLPTVQQLA